MAYLKMKNDPLMKMVLLALLFLWAIMVSALVFS